MRYSAVIFLSLFIFCFTALSAETVKGDEERFFYGSEADEDMVTVMPDKSFSNSGIQYGAIVSPVYIYEKGDDNSLSSSVVNAKVWAKSYLWKNSFLYAGVKNSWLKVISSDGDLYENVESDNVIDLDQAFLSMTDSDGMIKFSAGRKYYNIGTGLVLNGRGDGAEAVFSTSVFTFDLLGLYTGLLAEDSNPYGLSDKDYTDGAERIFSGGTVSIDIVNQQIYLFGLVQMDRADEDSDSETRYNSEYYGAGLQGVILGNVSYYAETVFESGESYITKPEGNEKSKIAAYAVNSGINYFIPLQFNPTLILQYAFGSGDKYRDDYTDGNRPDDATGYDKGFISFGTYSGGFALKPVLSNMHVFRGGVTIAPFSGAGSLILKKMSMGVKYSYYMKDEESSPIKSGEASLEDSDIGQGVDVSLRWQMFYDLSLYVNYGIFLPGAAYEDDGARNFIMTGLNLSF